MEEGGDFICRLIYTPVRVYTLWGDLMRKQITLNIVSIQSLLVSLYLETIEAFLLLFLVTSSLVYRWGVFFPPPQGTKAKTPLTNVRANEKETYFIYLQRKYLNEKKEKSMTCF